jgi:UDP-N-acetylglucosamine--N-acetylmuramyl-(pentapeptide) pyrophosphoryl-undecaprenol N-acetylglucosamine transferase
MKRKILLSGGGTMGPVSPLLAVYQEIKKTHPETEFLFIGTHSGPEKTAVEGYKIPFVEISSGKWRRYFDWRNFSDPFRIIAGFFQSLKIIKEFQPNALMVAGGFVGVPVVIACWLKRIPILVHHQDIEVGLANKLMEPFAKKVSVSFDVSLKDFRSGKAVLTGNPLRQEFYYCDRQKSLEFFKLKDEMPTVLITGGGTGSQKINSIVAEALPKLTKFCQVIHTTGAGKTFNFDSENYRQYEFLSHEMPEALCVADLVVARAGLSTLTELSICAKPAIVIPLYKTQQEHNAQYYQKHNAIVMVSEPSFKSEMLVSLIRDLLADKDKLTNLSNNISRIMPDRGAKQVGDLLLTIAK